MPDQNRSVKKIVDRLATIRRTMAELALEAERLMHEAEKMAQERAEERDGKKKSGGRGGQSSKG